MIEEIGTVTAVEGRRILVETQIKSTCGSCHAQENCGTSTIAKAFAPKTEQLSLECDEVAVVGQKVKLGIPEQQLLSASLLVYIVPLVVMIITALLSQSLLPAIGLDSELWVIFSTFAATGLTFWRIRQVLKRDNTHHYHPRLLALLPLEPAQQETIPIRIDD